MKTYYAYFRGEYPIGAVAAVKAANKSRAAELLTAELNARGLPQRSPLTEDAFVEIPRGEGVTILLDGNY